MDAAAKNAGGVGPGAYFIITSMGSIPAGAHGVIGRYTGRSWPNAYRRDCSNCLWHDDAHRACKRPGGWDWDRKFTRCISFRWRKGKPTIKMQGGEEHDTQL